MYGERFQGAGHPAIEQRLVARPEGGYHLITSDKRTGLHSQVQITREAAMGSSAEVEMAAREQIERMEYDYKRRQLDREMQMTRAQAQSGLYGATSAAIAGPRSHIYSGPGSAQRKAREDHMNDAYAYMMRSLITEKIHVPKSELTGPTIDLLDREGPLAYLRARTRHFIKDVRLTNG